MRRTSGNFFEKDVRCDPRSGCRLGQYDFRLRGTPGHDLDVPLGLTSTPFNKQDDVLRVGFHRVLQPDSETDSMILRIEKLEQKSRSELTENYT